MEKPKKYLYGAAVQGIQGFIFQTNELKDIVGASELVEFICTECFEEYKGSGELIVNAAGNIKCLFYNEDECRKVVREFPKKVMMTAPGITISEAVVKMDDDMEFGDAVELLEERLRAQRNKPFPSITTGLMGMERSRKTGLPAVDRIDDDYLDEGTIKKRKRIDSRLYKKFFGGDFVLASNKAWNVNQMTIDNSWLAIIHADGNGLGEIVSKIGKDIRFLSIFSKGLNIATSKAANKAYEDVVKSEVYKPETDVIPFRPVIIGGDDLTIICRADLAILFTSQFIFHFERNTAELMKQLQDLGAPIDINCLTACAGIAFIKESFPFYYGYNLAEDLCKKAKNDAKRNGVFPAPSCLIFHKVQSSFVESFEKIIIKELTPFPGHQFDFGPYYLHDYEGRWTIATLLNEVNQFKGKEGNSIKSDLRQWMTFMSKDIGYAEQKKKRVMEISSINSQKLFDIATTGYKRGNVLHYPAYDMLALHSIHTLVTKKKS